MLSDHVYDLIRQLITESQSLQHVRQYYQKDSEGCSDCQNFWKKMIDDKEDHVKELEGLLKAHLGD